MGSYKPNFTILGIFCLFFVVLIYILSHHLLLHVSDSVTLTLGQATI